MDDSLSQDNECMFAIKKYNTQFIFDKLRSDAKLANRSLEVYPGRYGSGPTPLHIACYYGRPQIVLALLNAGANPNIPNGEGVLPLWLTIGYDSMEQCMMTPQTRWRTAHSFYYFNNFNQINDCDLFDPYTDISRHDLQEAKGEARPDLSGVEDYFICARLLLEHGAKYQTNVIDKCEKERNFFEEAIKAHYFHIARAVVEHRKLLECFKEKSLVGLDLVREVFHSGTSSRIKRLQTGTKTRLAIVRALFQNDFDPEAKYEGNDMGIMHQLVAAMSKKAVFNENNSLEMIIHNMVSCKTMMIPMFDLLKSMRVPTDNEDVYGMTPLHYAIELNQVPLVQHMLATNSAKPIARSSKDKTPMCCLFDSEDFVLLLKVWFGDITIDTKICGDEIKRKLAPYLWMVATVSPYIPSLRGVMFHEDGKMCAVFDYLVRIYCRIQKDPSTFGGKDTLMDIDVFAMLAETQAGLKPRQPNGDSVAATERYDVECFCNKLLPERMSDWVAAFEGKAPNMILTPVAIDIVNSIEASYREGLAVHGSFSFTLAGGSMSGDERKSLVDEYDRMIAQTTAVVEAGSWLDSVIRGNKRVDVCKSIRAKKAALAAGEEPVPTGCGATPQKVDCNDCWLSDPWLSNVKYC